MLPRRVELRTSPLPRECSTTELRQRASPIRYSVTIRRRGPSDTRSCGDCKRNLDAGLSGHYIGRMIDTPKGKQSSVKPDKADRLAEALRENLRKRKAQSRARSGVGGSGAGDSGIGDSLAGVSENRPQIDPENDTDSGDTG